MINARQLELIRTAAQAAYADPFLDDIEDYVWEVIWAHSVGLPALSTDRSKRLFDVVDDRRSLGWSAKTLVWPQGAETCEFVIQRADVFKKADLLGHPGLHLGSDPQQIGTAVLAHWRMKFDADKEYQGVVEPRLALLLKSKDRQHLTPHESNLDVPDASEISWRWTDRGQSGLQGFDHKMHLRYRWYPNQKQLFEVFELAKGTPSISIRHHRHSVDEVIRRLGV